MSVFSRSTRCWMMARRAFSAAISSAVSSISRELFSSEVIAVHAAAALLCPASDRSFVCGSDYRIARDPRRSRGPIPCAAGGLLDSKRHLACARALGARCLVSFGGREAGMSCGLCAVSSWPQVEWQLYLDLLACRELAPARVRHDAGGYVETERCKLADNINGGFNICHKSLPPVGGAAIAAGRIGINNAGSSARFAFSMCCRIA